MTNGGEWRAGSILAQARNVEGWLDEPEAALLLSVTAEALSVSRPEAVVEIGSYCGRSTVVLASVVRALRPEAKVFAIDPHEGELSRLDGTRLEAPTLERFRRNIDRVGLTSFVELIQAKSFEVVWDRRISLLFIDGLHDYENVSRDFAHFENWVTEGGYVVFDDYDPGTYPGVVRLVDEASSSGRYRKVVSVGRMAVTQKMANAGELSAEKIGASDTHDLRREVARQRRVIEFLGNELARWSEERDAAAPPAAVAPIEIVEVSLAPLDSDHLRGRSIDLPMKHQRSDGHALVIAGWAIGTGARVVAIELTCPNSFVVRVPAEGSRPDVAAAYPDEPLAKSSGFETKISLVGTIDTTVQIVAILEGEVRAPIGTIRARHLEPELT